MNFQKICFDTQPPMANVEEGTWPIKVISVTRTEEGTIYVFSFINKGPSQQYSAKVTDGVLEVVDGNHPTLECFEKATRRKFTVTI